MEIRFYHMQKRKATEALPPLLEKIVSQAMDVHIWVGKDQLKRTDNLLWGYDSTAFLPHRSIENSEMGQEEASYTPVTLSISTTPPVAPDITLYLNRFPEAEEIKKMAGNESPQMICCLFDPMPDIVQKGRAFWRSMSDNSETEEETRELSSHELSYWQETARGGWKKKG